MDTTVPAFVRIELDLGALVLRPWGSELSGLTEELRAAVADPAIALWNPQPAVSTAEAEDWIAYREKGWEQGESAGFAILDPTGTELLGTVGLRWVDRASGSASIGDWTVPAARRRGVAVRATLAATRWAFDTAGVRRIELAHAVGNEPSCRVAARCGYLLEGTLRASWRFGDGRYHDEHLHARLVTDPDSAL